MTVVPQSAGHQLGASLMLLMLDTLEKAPQGASVICGGNIMTKNSRWTPQVISEKKQVLQSIVNAPTKPDNIWRDRVVKEGDRQ